MTEVLSARLRCHTTAMVPVFKEAGLEGVSSRSSSMDPISGGLQEVKSNPDIFKGPTTS